MKKKIFTVLLAALCLTLVACSSAENDARNVTLRDDVAPDDVAARMVAAVGGQGAYMEGDDDLYDLYFEESEAYPLLDDACMMFAREETNVSEFGVFKAKREEDVAAVRDMVQKYLDDRTEGLRAFAANYSPEELAKIDNASISTYGRYVVYDILDDADKDAAYRVIEDMLISESYKRTLQGGSFLYESPQPCHTNRIKNTGGVW